MSIKLVCIGKNKDDSIKVLMENYTKRIQPYINIKQVVLPDTSVSGTNDSRTVIDKESQKLQKYINKCRVKGKRPYIILLDRAGKMFDSFSLAEIIKDKMGKQEIIFLIGGVYGINDELKKQADLILSISRLTFTHQMVRVVIMEQIYRSLTIIHNKKYHY